MRETDVTLAPNLAGALKLTALDYPVFPKQANSKHEFSDKPERRGKPDYQPALTRKHATTDVSKIIEMFCDERLNVGYVVPAGRVIVDVDRERGDLEKLPEIGNTRVEQTADCNLHIAYVLPEHLIDVHQYCLILSFKAQRAENLCCTVKRLSFEAETLRIAQSDGVKHLTCMSIAMLLAQPTSTASK